MTTVYDVPSDMLIRCVAEKLKLNEKIKIPEKLKFIKTGLHREKAPSQSDWWYIRTAAVLRKVYLEQCVGTCHLASMFGGARDRGSKPDRAKKGSRAIIRHVLQQLEQAGYISCVKGKGRFISPSGKAFLDNTAHEVMQEVIKKIPEMSKY